MADAKAFSIIVIIWSGWSLATGKWSVCTFPLWNYKLMSYGLSNLYSVLHSCGYTLNPIQFNECLIPALFKALRWDCSLSPFSWGSYSCGDYCRGWYRELIWLCSKRYKQFWYISRRKYMLGSEVWGRKKSQPSEKFSWGGGIWG